MDRTLALAPGRSVVASVGVSRPSRRADGYTGVRAAAVAVAQSEARPLPHNGMSEGAGPCQ
jgi:hypothetical protein